MLFGKLAVDLRSEHGEPKCDVVGSAEAGHAAARGPSWQLPYRITFTWSRDETPTLSCQCATRRPSTSGTKGRGRKHRTPCVRPAQVARAETVTLNLVQNGTACRQGRRVCVQARSPLGTTGNVDGRHEEVAK